ncbi:MAG: alpha/beta hydrolase [Ruminococcus sp.]|nr:alpha/beta hydrolase [Ruminococcus sp.]MCM1381867.1 alpha/beta hydrolase [Muribaculaceae bacterium]MCM1478739.1 alpha/beta hydrolase [Muribaculaceae bacterium]
MNKTILGAAAIGTAAVGAACTAGALTLFNRVIPRQDELRVDLNEMADMKKWEEYRKIITPNKEWLLAQDLEHITIKSRDGLTLHGDFLPAENKSNKLAICGHGYTGCGLKDCAAISVFFHRMGYNCLIVDHRAHGKSEGDYIGFGILDRFDMKAWVDCMEKRFDGDVQIVLYGVSMGATIAVMTAGTAGLSHCVKAVVADCAFTSPYDVFSHILARDYHLPPFPVMNINDVLCRQKAGYGFKDYSTLDAVKSTGIPMLFIHGREDDFVPLYMTEQNYAACRSPKDIFIVDNAAHAASYYENKDAYEAKVKGFLEKYIH